MEFTFNTDMPFTLDPTESRIAVRCELHEAVIPSAAGPGHRAYIAIDWVDGLERELSAGEEAALLSGEYLAALEEEAEAALERLREQAREDREERDWRERNELRPLRSARGRAILASA